MGERLLYVPYAYCVCCPVASQAQTWFGWAEGCRLAAAAAAAALLAGCLVVVWTGGLIVVAEGSACDKPRPTSK